MNLSQWWDQNSAVVARADYTPLLDISGFLGILAFSVAVFTLTSPKFQIRQATAIISFRPLFFGTLLISAVITFAIEAGVLYGVRIPNFLSPNTINYLITAAIAILILYWMKICFISPPRFSQFTAKHFFQQTYVHIANGSKEEMLALAREIMREAPRLIRHTPRTKRHHFEDDKPVKLSSLQTHAHYLTALLSDTRFCDTVAKEIPSFPAHMVEVAIELERYDAPIQLMVKRTVIAMLNNPGSALFVENEWLGQGFIGNAKPISRAIFGNWYLLEGYEMGLEAPLDLDFPYARSWDTDTWRVYFGIAREYVRGLTSVRRANWDARGIQHILQTAEKAYGQLGDLKKYEDTFSPYNPTWHAKEANDFIKDLVKAFDESNGWVDFDRRDDFRYGHDLSSRLAALLFETIFVAAQVNTKEFRMWDVQHNTVWSPIGMNEVKDTKIMKMVRRKLRRMIWNEIVRMDDFPNYKGAAYVRFCLNVLGFYDESVHRNDTLERDSWPLTKVLAEWVKKNYQTIAISHPPVAEAMLPANIEYDREAQKLVRTQDDTLTGVPRLKTFALDPPIDAPTE
ncbi:hypothetical protein [Sedimentitalea todarodis]|uniref:Uncharacterized protein n=1 Tax=Sedimentitalea todarodis TaxID=1631240 RepID=A0ABU3VL17_9RHOB|nr:hypothetical protein [Sedimentitalea todarodis]MDU9006871.1 hypothetical protein [Sedimentitalea todarodis]